MKKPGFLSVVLAILILLGNMVMAEVTSFAYQNDPRENPEAMKDIVENPDAVYGFSPNPQSQRLGEYADAIDWTDPDQVAMARSQRQEYHNSMSELYRMIEDMLAEVRPVEEPPMSCPMRFEGVTYNEDGMLAEEDLLALLDIAIDAYDELEAEYGILDALDDAA